MSLLTAQGLSKYYAGNPVLLDINCVLGRGERIGLIGRNGTGKTTLLRLLAHLEDFDAGKIIKAKGVRLGYLTQGVELPESDTVWHYASSALGKVMQVEAELRQLQKAMGQPDVVGDPELLEKVMTAYTRVSAEFERLGGYDSEVQVRTTLTGLGLPEPVWLQTIASLSGGQRTRVALVRLLLEQPDILFLDEPTNHLDVDAIAWLEANLLEYSGALLVVSHDREFLDKVANKIWELRDHTLTTYNGNYSAYLLQKAERENRQELLMRQQQRERAQLERLVAKFKAGTRATAARNWEKRLARMETIKLPRRQRVMRLSVQTKRRSGNDVLTLQDVSKSYPNKPLFSNFTAEVKLLERIALVGPNGSGKTTLLKILLGELAPDAGRVKWGASIDLGYFSQDMQLPNGTDTVLESLLRDSQLLLAEARDYLARFLFFGDAVFQPVHTLSGGERNRLILAKLLLTGANVLVLDEPTNHLDIPAREALEQALYDYLGTLFIVSHDRYFLRRVATRVWHFTGGSITDYPFGYDEWQAALAQTAKTVAETKAQARKGSQAVKRQPSASSRQQTAQALEELELLIAELETERTELFEQMADPEIYQKGGGEELALRCHVIEQRLEELYIRWEEQATALAELDAPK
ncbi:MAG: ABC-F family ATP-binding cassette domain-containing protein [Firmicutes bacterium]|nr:ABC-F family ATP-binding cassette domain-containing protein [Bacillota bacterium]